MNQLLILIIVSYLAGVFSGAVIEYYDMINHIDHKKYFQKYRERKKWRDS